MNRPFKFRYASEVAGGFVLLGVLLLVVGFYVAGRAQGWFESNLELYTAFTTDEGTYGLQEGAEIRILGTLAGRVTEIRPGEQGGMQATFVVKGRFRDFVRKDSIGKVRKKFAVAGDSYVDLTLGTANAGLMRSGDQIQCIQDVEIIETAKRVLDDLREELLPLLEEFRQILSNVRGVTAELQKGEGTVGRLINDKELGAGVNQALLDLRKTSGDLPGVVAKADATVENARKALASLDEALEKFPKLAGDAQGVVADVKTMTGSLTGEVVGVQGVVLQAQESLRELERLVEGLQNHWLIRGGMKVPESTDLLPATLPAAPAAGGAP
jgi:phospholipid/cholesterol/gamma-HCH transport system substrate-binding protein